MGNVRPKKDGHDRLLSNFLASVYELVCLGRKMPKAAGSFQGLGMTKKVWQSAMLMLFITGSAPMPARADAPVAGVYAIKVCEGFCTADGHTVYVTGRVVLFAGMIRDIKGDARRDIFLYKEANGCFRLTRLREPHPSLIGYQKSGYLQWKRDPKDGSIHFSLFPSPDAGYEARLHESPHGWSGTGASWYALGGGGSHPIQDAVIMTRLSSPAKAACEGVQR